MRVAVDAMGGDHGPDEVVNGTLRHAQDHPLDRFILVGDEATIRGIAGELPENVSIVHASQVIGMDESPALALREKKDATILVATELVKRGEADALVTAGHTGAGMAAAVLKLGRLPGVDRPALAVQMITDTGPFVLLDIGANPDSTPHNLAQYAQMGAIFAKGVLGVSDPRVALLSIGEEKGKGDARIQAATDLLDASRPALRGQRRGQGPHEAPRRRRRLRRGARQRRDQVLRGPLDLHLRPVPRGVPCVVARPPRVPPAAPGDQPDSAHVRLRAGRRVAAAGRSRNRDHHPRPGAAADDRLRLRRGRYDGQGARARADRRGAATSACSGDGGSGAGRAGGGVVTGPILTVGQEVITEMVRLAAMEVPGVARVGRGGPRWRALGGRAVRARLHRDKVEVRVWIVARPGQPLVSLTAQVRSAVAATVERLLGLELGGVTVLVDGVGG